MDDNRTGGLNFAGIGTMRAACSGRVFSCIAGRKSSGFGKSSWAVAVAAAKLLSVQRLLRAVAEIHGCCRRPTYCKRPNCILSFFLSIYIACKPYQKKARSRTSQLFDCFCTLV